MCVIVSFDYGWISFVDRLLQLNISTLKLIVGVAYKFIVPGDLGVKHQMFS